MTIAETLVASAPPVHEHPDGAVRVVGTRIPIDTVVREYWNGMTPEDIVSSYDTLGLAEVYAVLAYYLKNREVVDEYLKARERQAEAIRAEIEVRSPMKDIRERLLARRARQLAERGQ
jgi:uncharacterized protein (DUF433 family)